MYSPASSSFPPLPAPSPPYLPSFLLFFFSLLFQQACHTVWVYHRVWPGTQDSCLQNCWPIPCPWKPTGSLSPSPAPLYPQPDPCFLLPGAQPSPPVMQPREGPQPQGHIRPVPGVLMPRSWPPWGHLQKGVILLPQAPGPVQSVRAQMQCA